MRHCERYVAIDDGMLVAVHWSVMPEKTDSLQERYSEAIFGCWLPRLERIAVQFAVSDAVGGVVIVWRGTMPDAPTRIGTRKAERTRMAKSD